MELTTGQIFGILISIIVIALLIYWLTSKIKTKRTTFSDLEKDNKKANEFTQKTVNLVDKVLSDLKLSTRKNQSIKFCIHEGHSIHYEDINLIIHTDNYHAANLKYKGQEILIYPNEAGAKEKIQKFFLDPAGINNLPLSV